MSKWTTQYNVNIKHTSIGELWLWKDRTSDSDLVWGVKLGEKEDRLTVTEHHSLEQIQGEAIVWARNVLLDACEELA